MIPQNPQNGDLLYQKAWTCRFFGSHIRCPQLYLRLGNSLLTSSLEPENHSSRLQCIIYMAEGGQRAPGCDRRNERASLASREEQTSRTKPQKPSGRARLACDCWGREPLAVHRDSSGHSEKAERDNPSVLKIKSTCFPKASSFYQQALQPHCLCLQATP